MSMFPLRRLLDPRSGWLLLALGWAAGTVSRAGAQPGSVQAALLDMQSLETGLTAVALDTGYFVALENLDDSAEADVTLPHDDINQGGGAWVIRPERGRFEEVRVVFRPAPFGVGGPGLWPSGGYVVFQRGIQTGPTPYDVGSPLDPWGTPYFFFSPLGLIRGDSGALTQEFYGDAFDRYALVSFGQNRVFGGGDDLVRLMGVGVTRLAISSIVGPSVVVRNSPAGSDFAAPHRAEITLRGYRLGAEQGDSKVFHDSVELSAVLAWSSTAVTLRLPDGHFGAGALTVRVAGETSNALQLLVLPNAVRRSDLYR